jgi:uncharacterized protein involved in exopolysaccharide biosynthesis
MEFVLPMYEQAKVEEQKSVPTVLILDKAVPPELKYSPKRSVIILGILVLFSFFLVPFVFVGENVMMRNEFKNPLQYKISNFYTQIKKIYRMKS